MPDTLASMIRAKHPGAYDDLSDADLESAVKAKYPGVYDDLPTSQPRSWLDTAEDVGKGILKGAARTGLDAVRGAGYMLGVPNLVAGPAEAARPEYANTAQQVGGGIETAAELAAPTIEAARGVSALTRLPWSQAAKAAAPIVMDGVSDIPVIGKTVKGAAKVLRGVDVARKALAGVLDAASAEAAPSVESVPSRLSYGASDKMTFGYAPEPAPPLPPAPSPNAGGRLVRPTDPSLAQVVSDAIDEARAPAPPAKITTPPQPDLPPSYTPRTSAPKVKPAPAQAPAPKRAYFLKSPEQIAEERAAAAEPVEPVNIATADLPASWRSRVNQDVLRINGIHVNDVAEGFAQELRDRGMSAKDAIDLVTKNPALTPLTRLRLVESLKRAGGIQ